METILLLIEHQQNRQILSQWLIKKYRTLSPQESENFLQKGRELLTQNFDLCFIDFGAINLLRQDMLARRELETPLLLPFIFFTPLQDIGLSTDHLEPLIDDIIYIPIQKIELRTKLRVLLRSRSHSLQLQSAKEELNRALVKEKELNQLKSRFISMVSHEFRNPLNGISGMAQLLNAYGDRLSPEKKVEVLAGLQRNVTKMTELLDEVLEISRNEMGKLPFNPAPLALEMFCRGLISEVETAFKHKQSINFVYQGESEKKFNLDRKILNHILNNLLANACKYSPQDTVIDFKVSCFDSEILFVICDRGIGIPAAEIPSLFDSFYRASNSEDYQGTGLGLTIVKQYVELHQGAISVSSELGVGTTFTITIPYS